MTVIGYLLSNMHASEPENLQFDIEQGVMFGWGFGGFWSGCQSVRNFARLSTMGAKNGPHCQDAARFC